MSPGTEWVWDLSFHTDVIRNAKQFHYNGVHLRGILSARTDSRQMQTTSSLWLSRRHLLSQHSLTAQTPHGSNHSGNLMKQSWVTVWIWYLQWRQLTLLFVLCRSTFIVSDIPIWNLNKNIVCLSYSFLVSTKCSWSRIVWKTLLENDIHFRQRERNVNACSTSPMQNTNKMTYTKGTV